MKNNKKLIFKNIAIALLSQLIIYILIFIAFYTIYVEGVSRGGMSATMKMFVLFLYIHFSLIGVYIIPLIISAFVSYRFKLKLKYWFFSIPFLWLLIMCYQPERFYELPINESRYLESIPPLGVEVALFCFKLFILQCIITFVISLIKERRNKYKGNNN